MGETPSVRGVRLFVGNEASVSALEYAVLVGVVSMALVTILTTFNDEIGDALSQIGGNLVSTASGIGL